MNERIEKLAEQAEEDTRIKHVNAYWRMQDELAEDATWRGKFAELIIKECIQELETSKKGDIYTGELFNCEWNDCIDSQIAMLKDHFEVE